ncbi:hypothetical protein [Roseomonas indoligenes]|uniref:Uncharacterized protein n=1 Tax=Roseomonas indoligenes TaxID=2820811 RepID=A0A940N4E2_9PROT|nr:hypothetical protein [Pararoseomonas indoligenes]MBP0494002.1 hypothetical protein [Pararoseomonas indoligenes]
MKAALEVAGVEFIDADGGGPGVCLASVAGARLDNFQGGVTTTGSNHPIDENGT